MQAVPSTSRAASARLAASLQSQIAGHVLAPGDADYEASRLSWNRVIDRRPALIVRCQTVEDVVHGVTAARGAGLPLAVRSGGHSPAGFSTSDGGLLLDLSGLDALTVDADRRVAHAGPGLTWGAYTGQTSAYGLATPAGDSASVGVGGLTLGGGIGWLARKYGMTIDHLLEAEVVTADGAVLTANAAAHADLFWALRGGGGNFGVVTRLRFRLVPVGQVFAGMLVFPAEPAVLAAFARAAAAAPDGLTTIALVMRTPPLPFLPATLHGRLHLHAGFCYAGDAGDGARALAPLRAVAPLLGQMAMPLPYPGIFRFTADTARSGPYSVRSHFLSGLPEDAAGAILEHMEQATSPHAMAQIRVLGGALARVPVESTAFAQRAAPIFFAALNPWEAGDRRPVAQHQAWTAEIARALAPWAAGAYANFQGDEGGTAAAAVYPAGTYARLAAIKARYDPGNLFRANCNVAPAA